MRASCADVVNVFADDNGCGRYHVQPANNSAHDAAHAVAQRRRRAAHGGFVPDDKRDNGNSLHRDTAAAVCIP
jgi:hypothetical protein